MLIIEWQWAWVIFMAGFIAGGTFIALLSRVKGVYPRR